MGIGVATGQTGTDGMWIKLFHDLLTIATLAPFRKGKMFLPGRKVLCRPDTLLASVGGKVSFVKGYGS